MAKNDTQARYPINTSGNKEDKDRIQRLQAKKVTVMEIIRAGLDALEKKLG